MLGSCVMGLVRLGFDGFIVAACARYRVSETRCRGLCQREEAASSPTTAQACLPCSAGPALYLPIDSQTACAHANCSAIRDSAEYSGPLYRPRLLSTLALRPSPS